MIALTFLRQSNNLTTAVLPACRAVELSGGATATLLLNTENVTRTLVASWASLGLDEKQVNTMHVIVAAVSYS